MGFGTAPPRRNRSSQSLKETAVGEAAALKEAEKLIQLILGDDREKLTKASIQKATQQYELVQSKTQIKRRYSNLLEKPWRTTPSDHCSSSRDDDARVTEIENKNAQSFRSFRRNSLDTASWHPRTSAQDRLDHLLAQKEEDGDSKDQYSSALTTELFQARSDLKQAKQQIATLQKELSAASTSMDDSMPSFAVDNGDSFANASFTPSTTPFLQAKIRSLETELAQQNEQRIVEVNVMHDNKVLLAKVESLEKSIAVEEKFKEQKRQQAYENQVKITELEDKLTEQEEKLTEQQSRQCEQVQSLLDQLAKSEALLQDQEKSHRTAMQEALEKHTTDMKATHRESMHAREMRGTIHQLEKQLAGSLEELAEQETRQCEQVQSLLDQLAEADEKLSEQEKRHTSEMRKTVERQNSSTENMVRERVRLELSEMQSKVSKLESQLAEAEGKLLEQENRHSNEMQAILEKQAYALDSSHRETDQRVLRLNHDLTVANGRAQEATKRLQDLEQAQAREQEILSEELRESEATIAGLMDELSSLRPVATELEQTRYQLENTQSELKKSDQKVAELVENTNEMLQSLKESRQEEAFLREELDLLAPLATDLEMAEEALRETQSRLVQMEERMKELKETKKKDHDAKADLRLYEAQAAELQNELVAVYDESKHDKEKADALEQERKVEIEMLVEQLKESKVRIASLESELNDALRNALTEEKQVEEMAEAGEEIDRLRKALAQKEREIKTLTIEVSDQQKQIQAGRQQLEDMEEERHYSRAKLKELSSHVNGRSEEHGSQERLQKRLLEKTRECSKLAAERDTIRQKLTVLEATVAMLEADNKQKKDLVHELMSSSKSSTSSAALVVSLQDEKERTMERCNDLSLQLAESQFKIDDLTGKLRKLERRPPSAPERSYSSMSTAFNASGNFKNMLSSSLHLVQGQSMNTPEKSAGVASQSLHGEQSSYRRGLFARTESRAGM